MSSLGGPSIVTSGLVLHLDASNIKSYSGTGSTWYDRSGNLNGGVVNNVTLANGPTFSSLNSGSIGFDGINDWCYTTPFSLTSSTNSLSFNFWVRISGTTSFNQTLIGKDGYGFPHLFIARTNSSDNIRFNWEQGPSQISNFFTGTNNLWTNIQITAVYGSPSNAKFYKNGSYIDIMLGGYQNFPYTNSPANIGGVGYGNWLTGNIASVQIYNRELSATEVLQNYNATKSRFGL
jgi:hypothetical protein